MNPEDFELSNIEVREENLRIIIEELTIKFNKASSACDMLKDEIDRIAACPGVTSEILQLCQRAKQITDQRVPVIRQRDWAMKRMREEQAISERLKEELEIYKTYSFNPFTK